MKIWILIVVSGDAIEYEKKYISKSACESHILKDEFGTFVLGDCDRHACIIYNKEKWESYFSEQISEIRKKIVFGHDSRTLVVDFHNNEFMCVESTL